MILSKEARKRMRDNKGWGVPSFVLAAALLFFVPTADASSQQLLQGAQEAVAVSEGHGPRVVYIFFDPNCPYCHLLYGTFQPLIRRDQLTVHWIPVGIVSPSSLGKAAAILDARSPAAALAYNESHYDARDDEGGIDEALPSRKTRALVRRNGRFLARAPVDAVPTTVLREAGGRVLVIQGALSPLALQKALNTLPASSSLMGATGGSKR